MARHCMPQKQTHQIAITALRSAAPASDGLGPDRCGRVPSLAMTATFARTTSTKASTSANASHGPGDVVAGRTAVPILGGLDAVDDGLRDGLSSFRAPRSTRPSVAFTSITVGVSSLQTASIVSRHSPLACKTHSAHSARCQSSTVPKASPLRSAIVMMTLAPTRRVARPSRRACEGKWPRREDASVVTHWIVPEIIVSSGVSSLRVAAVADAHLPKYSIAQATRMETGVQQSTILLARRNGIRIWRTSVQDFS
jgi:hypothetical protein